MEVTTVFLLEQPEGETPLLKKNKTGQLHFFCVQFLCHRGNALYRKYASTHAVVMGLYPASFIH